MARTLQQQLDDLDAAIESIEKRGQSYSIGDRTLTRADLPKMHAERRKLAAQVAREAAGGVRVRYGTPVS